MPREHFGKGFKFLPRADVLSFEEIVRVARVLCGAGLRKVRLTGGEPTLRADLHVLVSMLASLPGLDLALTTNGVLLADQALPLFSAGLRRITVSLDSLDDGVYRAMTDGAVGVETVLAGIESARRAGFSPIKINAVVRRGVNDAGIVELARYFKDKGDALRFIEYMDVGTTNGWQLEHVVSGREIVRRIDKALPLEPLEAGYRGEVARRYRYRDGSAEIGVITSVTQPFCGNCTRARLTADGKLVTCLFATTGLDLREPLRDGRSDEALCDLVREAWSARQDRYSELRSSRTAGLPRIEMSYVGG
jgi:cyclic pyranopterin phosphate synthase